MTNNMVRIQIDLPEDKVKALEALMAEADIGTRKELFNNALTVLEWMVNETKEGRVIASINEQTMSYKQLVMPILSTVLDRVKRAKQAEQMPVVA